MYPTSIQRNISNPLTPVSQEFISQVYDMFSSTYECNSVLTLHDMLEINGYVNNYRALADIYSIPLTKVSVANSIYKAVCNAYMNSLDKQGKQDHKCKIANLGPFPFYGTNITWAAENIHNNERLTNWDVMFAPKNNGYGWTQSPSHEHNIMKDDVDGMGVAKCGGFWAQGFERKKGKRISSKKRAKNGSIKLATSIQLVIFLLLFASMCVFSF